MAKTKLKNDLDRYSSYSIHYVMLACRSTSDASVFTSEDPDILRDTLSAITQVPKLGLAVSYAGRNDVAYLVMDTRRFSQFSISKLKYEAIINGVVNNETPPNLATSVEMTILDSVGISFINFLQDLMDSKMKTNFDGMIYMLRILFIGHHPDGTTSQVQSVTLPLMMTKLELNLDHAKGEYTVEFIPMLAFSVQKSQRWTTIGTATKFVTRDNTLGTLIDNMQLELNKLSASYYEEAQNLMKGARADQVGSNEKFGRKVRYMITIPDHWNVFTFVGAATEGSTETKFGKDKNDVGQPTSSHFAVNAGVTITNALDEIFKKVPAINDLGNGRIIPGEAGSVSFYKYLVGLTSDNDDFIVHVDVIEFLVPNVSSKPGQVSQDTSQLYTEIEENGRRTGVRIPNSYMEFDYIFTGQNENVLNFDMKLQDLQILLTSNMEVGYGSMQAEAMKGQGESAPVINRRAELVMARPYDPILMPKNTRDELENFTNYSKLVLAKDEGKELIKSRQDYTRNLSAFYAMSPITVAMTIKGNPDIMVKFANQQFQPHTAPTDNNQTDKKAYREALDKTILKQNTKGQGKKTVETLEKQGDVFVVKSLGDKSYAAEPAFVKVNIKGPAADYANGELANGEAYAKDVLYNNFYVVMKVTNLIEGSNFTQDLELWSHNMYGQGKMGGVLDATPPPARVTTSPPDQSSAESARLARQNSDASPAAAPSNAGVTGSGGAAFGIYPNAIRGGRRP